MLYPRKPKFFKSFSNKKILNKTQNEKKTISKYSQFGLISHESGFIPNFQIEAVRLVLRRVLRKKNQIFFHMFPNQPITKKPNEIRLGRGKGNFKYWSFQTQKNKQIIEIKGVNSKIIISALQLIRCKLSIKTYIFNQKSRWTL